MPQLQAQVTGYDGTSHEIERIEIAIYPERNQKIGMWHVYTIEDFLKLPDALKIMNAAIRPSQYSLEIKKIEDVTEGKEAQDGPPVKGPIESLEL